MRRLARSVFSRRKKSKHRAAKAPRMRVDARAASRLLTFLGILAAIIVTVWVWIIYQPGRANHTRLLTPETRCRVSLHPAMAQDYISSLAPNVTKYISVIPRFTSLQARAIRVDWIHALPYEITFLAEPKSTESVGITLYVNTIPDKGSFVSEVNASQALRELRPIQWSAPALVAGGEQQFTASGAAAVPGDASSLLEAWPKSAGSLARYRGAHLIEVDADNSTGILLALHRAFRNSFFDWATPETNAALVALWPQVDKLELNADVERSDDLVFRLKLRGNRAFNKVDAEAALNAAAMDLSAYLAARQLAFTVEFSWPDALTCEAVAHLRDFEARVHAVWRD